MFCEHGNRIAAEMHPLPWWTGVYLPESPVIDDIGDSLEKKSAYYEYYAYIPLFRFSFYSRDRSNLREIFSCISQTLKQSLLSCVLYSELL